jgi:hypothetical protein
MLVVINKNITTKKKKRWLCEVHLNKKWWWWPKVGALHSLMCCLLLYPRTWKPHEKGNKIHNNKTIRRWWDTHMTKRRWLSEVHLNKKWLWWPRIRVLCSLMHSLLFHPYTLKPHKGGIKTHKDKTRKRWQHTHAWQKENDEVKLI